MYTLCGCVSLKLPPSPVRPKHNTIIKHTSNESSRLSVCGHNQKSVFADHHRIKFDVYRVQVKTFSVLKRVDGRAVH